MGIVVSNFGMTPRTHEMVIAEVFRFSVLIPKVFVTWCATVVMLS
jgi:hypothetical protein